MFEDILKTAWDEEKGTVERFFEIRIYYPVREC